MSQSATFPLVVVAGHICLDVHVDTGATPPDALILPGKLVEVGTAHFSGGGPVANTGLALHKLGVPVRLVGKTGDDAFGRATAMVLQSAGSDLADGLIVSPGDASSYTVVISPPGVDRSFLHCPGANHTFAADDIPDEKLDGAQWLHFGYPPLMERIYSSGGAEAAKIFKRARSLELVTSLDMSLPDPAAPSGKVDWQQWLAAVLPLVDVYMPSFDETLFMLDRPQFDQLAAGEVTVPEFLAAGVHRQLAERLLAMGAGIVGLKLGECGFFVAAAHDKQRLKFLRDGSASEWKSTCLERPCFIAEVAGTTGAGDATIAGFIAAISSGASPEHAATMAVAVGACSVEAADASSGVPPWNAVVRRVKEGWATR